MTNEQMNPYEPCREDGECSECGTPYGCRACENCQGETETPLVDETDPGIVYCSPECRDEFVAAAEDQRDGDAYRRWLEARERFAAGGAR